MLTIKHQLAEDFGSRIIEAVGDVIIKRRGEAGFAYAVRDSNMEDTAIAVLIYKQQDKGVCQTVVSKGDKCCILNSSGNTVESFC